MDSKENGIVEGKKKRICNEGEEENEKEEKEGEGVVK